MLLEVILNSYRLNMAIFDESFWSVQRGKELVRFKKKGSMEAGHPLKLKVGYSLGAWHPTKISQVKLQFCAQLESLRTLSQK